MQGRQNPKPCLKALSPPPPSFTAGNRLPKQAPDLGTCVGQLADGVDNSRIRVSGNAPATRLALLRAGHWPMGGCCSRQRRMKCFWSCCHGHCRKHRTALWLPRMLARCSPASADVLHPVRRPLSTPMPSPSDCAWARGRFAWCCWFSGVAGGGGGVGGSPSDHARSSWCQRNPLSGASTTDTGR